MEESGLEFRTAYLKPFSGLNDYAGKVADFELKAGRKTFVPNLIGFALAAYNAAILGAGAFGIYYAYKIAGKLEALVK